MRITRDRRSISAQAISGLKIAGAMVASFMVLALIAISCELIADSDGGDRVVVGWLLMLVVACLLVTTVQYWRHWFYFLPGYVALRSLLWGFLGWFLPRGYIFLLFLLLMAVMAMLSYRFSQLDRIVVTDRIALMSALACFVGTITGVLLIEPKISALLLAGLGDLILLLQWNVIRKTLHRKPRLKNS